MQKTTMLKGLASAALVLGLAGCETMQDTSELERQIAAAESGEFSQCLNDSYHAAAKLQEARESLSELKAGSLSESEMTQGLAAAADAQALRSEAEDVCRRESKLTSAEDAARIAALHQQLALLNERLEGLESRREILRGVTFETNSARLTPEARVVLQTQAEKLMGSRSHVEVAGYASTTGSAERNLELSQLRADAVRAYLIESGVSSEQLLANGYGTADPIASNDTQSGRRANQRIELRYRQ